MPSRLAVWILLASALGSGGCAYSMIADGQLREAPFEAVLARTVAARGIELESPIDARVIPAAEIESLLRRAIAREMSEEEIRNYERALTAMGLWPGDRDLLGEYFAVMSEEIVGLYDPAERVLYIVSDAKIPFRVRLVSALLRRDLDREFSVSHELVHLLQHQRYPSLLETDPFYLSQDDAAGAIQAAIEGDATRYGLEALELLDGLPSPKEFSEEVDVAMRSSRKGALAEAPALIQLTFAFPYTYGYHLSHREGEQLLESPPTSTEQVLHPEKRRASFLAIDLLELRGALPADCVFLHENSLGELGLSVLFRDLGDGTDEDAWAGWDGDRYLVAECGNGPELLWLTSWDSQSDAIEFESAYRALAAALVARAGFAAPLSIARADREVRIHSDAFAGEADALLARARRRRVSTLAELRDFFGASAGEAGARDE